MMRSDLVDDWTPIHPLAPAALEIAAVHEHPVYDMLYAILARRLGATVVTRDRKLARILDTLEIPSFAA